MFTNVHHLVFTVDQDQAEENDNMLVSVIFSTNKSKVWNQYWAVKLQFKIYHHLSVSMLAHYPSTINPTFTLIKYSLSVNINTSLEMKKIKIIQTVAVNVYQHAAAVPVRETVS